MSHHQLKFDTAIAVLQFALESYISINQVNMNRACNKQKNLSACVNGCKLQEDVQDKNCLLNCIFQHKSIDLAAAKLDTGGMINSMDNRQEFDNMVQELGT